MIKRNISDFIREKQKEGEYIVYVEGSSYVDGINKIGEISFCRGFNEFESEEEALRFYQAIQTNSSNREQSK